VEKDVHTLTPRGEIELFLIQRIPFVVHNSKDTFELLFLFPFFVPTFTVLGLLLLLLYTYKRYMYTNLNPFYNCHGLQRLSSTRGTVVLQEGITKERRPCAFASSITFVRDVALATQVTWPSRTHGFNSSQQYSKRLVKENYASLFKYIIYYTNYLALFFVLTICVYICFLSLVCFV
jgi:hypothetical protein